MNNRSALAIIKTNTVRVDQNTSWYVRIHTHTFTMTKTKTTDLIYITHLIYRWKFFLTEFVIKSYKRNLLKYICQVLHKRIN